MRIKVDLSEFLEDERKFSVLKVKLNETKTVRDVISKISHMFSVLGAGEEEDDGGRKKPALGLFDEGFYIHPDETAAVLEDSGVLKLRSLPKPGGARTDGKKKKKSKKEPVAEQQPCNGEEGKGKKWQKGKPLEEEVMMQEVAVKKKKDKKGKVSEELHIDLEVEDTRKTKKRKRYRATEDTSEVQIDLDDPQEERKPKKSRLSEGSSISDEVTIKEQYKLRRGGSAEEEIRVEEYVEPLKEKKKGRKSRTEEDLLPPLEEMGEIPMKKKKRKKEKVGELPVSDDTPEETKRKKPAEFPQALELKTSKKKTQRSLTEEEWEAPEPHQIERKKRKLKADKSSQEKVVSTSTVINLESEGLSEKGSDSSLDSISDLDKFPCYSTKSEHSQEHCAADSVTGPLIPQLEECTSKPRKKRKRKHAKKKRADKQNDNFTNDFTSQAENSGGVSRVTSVRHISHPGPRSKRPLLNSSFARTHVVFNSDDEEVTSLHKGEPLQDIEIVETHATSAMDKKLRSGMVRPSQGITGRVRDISGERSADSCRSSHNSDDSFSPNKAKKGSTGHSILKKTAAVVVEVEKEASPSPYTGEHSSMHSVPSRSPVHKSKASSLDELATLRKICENKTITVCKIDSRKDQPKPKPEEDARAPSSPCRRPPPSPGFTPPVEISSEQRKALKSLMSLKNNTIPAVFPKTKQGLSEVSPGLRYLKGHTESSDTATPSFNRNSSNEGNVDGQDIPLDDPLQILSSNISSIHQKYNKEKEERRELRPTSRVKAGAAIQSNVAEKPRILQSIGAILSSMRNKSDHDFDSGELQVLSNDEAETSNSPKKNQDFPSGKQSFAERKAKSPDIHFTAATSSPNKKSRPTNQSGQTGTSLPSNRFDEVVDLEDEEKAEVPFQGNNSKSGESSAATNFPVGMIKECKKASSIIECDREKEADNVVEVSANKRSESDVHVKGFESMNKALLTKVAQSPKKADKDISEFKEDCEIAACSTRNVNSTSRNTSKDSQIEECNAKSPMSTTEIIDDEEVVGEGEEEDEEDLYAGIIDEEDHEESDYDYEIIEETGAFVPMILGNQEKNDVPKGHTDKTKKTDPHVSIPGGQDKTCSSVVSSEEGKKRVTDNPVNAHETRGKTPSITPSKFQSEAETPSTVDTILLEGRGKALSTTTKTQDESGAVCTALATQAAAAQEEKETMKEAQNLLIGTLKQDLIKEVKTVKSEDQGEMNEAFYKKFPLMGVVPKVGEFIAVKLMVLDDCYSLSLSNYKPAQVLAVDGFKIKLKFMDKMKPQELKTAATGEEEVQEVDLTTTEQEEGPQVKELDWRDLLEPRHLFP